MFIRCLFVHITFTVAASPACAVSVNGSGTLLAFGTEDAKVVLLDIRRAQFPHLATLDCHSSDVRAVRFAPSNPNYLLTGSYDSKLAVTYCGGLYTITMACTYQVSIRKPDTLKVLNLKKMKL